MFKKTLMYGAVTSLCILSLDCGSHPKHTSGSTGATSTTKTNSISDASGVAADGNAGSEDPHPAACTTCEPDHVSEVKPNDANNLNPKNLTCDPAATLGTVAPCEGLCFVDPNVTPQWHNEPPSSGPAYPTPSYGFGLQQEIVPRGTWVHNLAHGYVVLTYNCPSGCASDVATLQQIYDDLAGQTILITADPELKGSKFAAIAFNYQMTFDVIDVPKVECFIMQHVGHGYPHGNYVPPLQ